MLLYNTESYKRAHRAVTRAYGAVVRAHMLVSWGHIGQLVASKMIIFIPLIAGTVQSLNPGLAKQVVCPHPSATSLKLTPTQKQHKTKLVGFKS